jgi:hypothetical protein
VRRDATFSTSISVVTSSISARGENAEDAAQERSRDPAAAVIAYDADEPEPSAPHTGDADVVAARVVDRDHVQLGIRGGRLLGKCGLLPPPAVRSRDVLAEHVVELSQPVEIDVVDCREDNAVRRRRCSARIRPDDVPVLAPVLDEAGGKPRLEVAVDRCVDVDGVVDVIGIACERSAVGASEHGVMLGRWSS